MVQPKFDKNESKPAPSDISSVSQNKENSKKTTRFYADYIMHVAVIFLWSLRLFEVIMGNGPVRITIHILRDNIGSDFEPSGDFLALLVIVILQLDALCHVFIFCNMYTKTSQIKLHRDDVLFKYIQFCIPQAVLAGLVLVQPHGFDLHLHIQITFILNTCVSLVVVIQSYTRMLRTQMLGEKELQKLANQLKECSDEIPKIIVPCVPVAYANNKLASFNLPHYEFFTGKMESCLKPVH